MQDIDFHNELPYLIEDDIKEIALLLTDMLDNIYELGVNFSIQPCGEKNEIHIFSGFDIKKTSLIINHK